MDEGGKARSVVVATHGHCFDGMCSAALFTRLLGAVDGPGARFTYRACGYGPQPGGVDPRVLDGDVNAILDFRYAASPALTWYFDHHATAFDGDADRADFAADGGKRKFFDPTYGSCTKLVHDVSRDVFGLGDGGADLVELVRWADIIDAARFPTAEMAVMRDEPALWLMTVVEHDGDDAFLARVIPRLLDEPLAAVASSKEVQERWLPLRESHLAFVDRVRKRGATEGHVVFLDLTDQPTEVVGKFVTYALWPKSVYSVVVSAGKTRSKVSVGYNPWSGAARTHDISAICKRYGGGGHPVVGAVTLPAADVDRARTIAHEIARELDA